MIGLGLNTLERSNKDGEGATTNISSHVNFRRTWWNVSVGRKDRDNHGLRNFNGRIRNEGSRKRLRGSTEY